MSNFNKKDKKTTYGNDFLYYEQLLSAMEQEKLTQIKKVLEKEIKPIIQNSWALEKLPNQVITTLKKIDILSLPFRGYSFLFDGFVSMELTRLDASIATIFGVHNDLFTASVELLASEEQKKRWLADFRNWTKIGAFALSEPTGGSDISHCIKTTAKREGDVWTLQGKKRWIGNATWSDYCLVWAKDLADGNIKAFMVDTKSVGYKASKIENKIALRMVENADITLDNVKVLEKDRLALANSFQDTNKVLKPSRVGVAWQTVGLQLAAIDVTKKYVLERTQFGKPLASFQMIQAKLVKMLGNATASFGMLVRVAQLEDAGLCTDEQASLAKSYNSVLMRETVSLGREIFGGNGIVLDYDIAKIFSDAEAIYSYEGTYEINTLVVGRAFTGTSAFI